ncbi:MAG: GAF domain-containing protein [Gammaproteobacteria bacterium]|nr:GAF domain-containing protein [Gammaproteobacteria bacterium]
MINMRDVMGNSERQTEWVQGLHEIVQKITSEKLSVVLQELLDYAVEGFQADSGSLSLLRDNQRLEITAGSSSAASFVGSEIKVGDGIIGWVAKYKEPLLLKDSISNDNRFKNIVKREGSSRPTSSMCWPLLTNRELVGVISINRGSEQPAFSDEDFSGAGLIISLVSLMVDNARLSLAQKHRLLELSEANTLLEEERIKVESEHSERIAIERSAAEELRREKDEQIALNKQLKEAQDQLLQSEKMASIGQLAAGVAHEINNPVSYINSNINTLESYLDDLMRLIDAYERSGHEDEIVKIKREIDLDYLKEDLSALLSESKEGVVRVKQIIQDLKDFSHVDEMEWQWADLHKGIDSTLNVVHNEIKYKAEVIKEYGELPLVECVVSQINQVVMNLLVNAVHAIEEHGTIIIRTGVEGKDVWIEIEDTGNGMDDETKKLIFDPFFTTKPVGSGTGLGLSLSYGIIQKHNGDISVNSELGRGTSFHITLPIKHVDQEISD